MKFRIFGNGDCSDMFLAQFVPVSSLAPSDVQQLGERVVALAVTTNGAAQSAQRDDLFVNDPPVSLPPAEMALAACALHTVLTNICIFDVDAQQAARELVILGLSQPAAEALVHVAAANRQALLASMSNSVRMAPTVARAHVKKADDEEGNQLHDEYVVLLDKRSSGASTNSAASAQQVVSFSASGSALRSLLSELITARETMNL